MDKFKQVFEKYTSKEEVDKMKVKAKQIADVTVTQAKVIADKIIKQADVQIQAYKEKQKNKPKDGSGDSKGK